MVPPRSAGTPPATVTPFAGRGGRGAGNLLWYHGGPVMHTNTTYAIYWAPAGYSPPGGGASFSPGYLSTINGYFANVATASGATTNVYAVETQYCDGIPSGSARTSCPAGSNKLLYSSTFGGSWTDTATPFPTPGCNDGRADTNVCLTDLQIQAEIAHAIAHEGWTPSPTNTFFLFTPRGVGSCSGFYCAFTDYCAYHDSFLRGGSQVIYANQPYAAWDPAACGPGQSPNSDDADATINVASHEHREQINDPQPSFNPAWQDGAGYEGSDKCAWNFGATLGGLSGQKYNQVINGGHYYLQQEWSNASNGCALGFTAGSGGGGGTVPGITSFTPSGYVGDVITITGSGFTGASKVTFAGTTASFNVVNDGEISATVPAVKTGVITVKNTGGVATTSTSFLVLPKITGFSPSTSRVGSWVTVTGSGFLGTTAVRFNGIAATFKGVTNGSLRARVPAGATTGPLSIVTPGGTALSDPFTPSARPARR
jgi:hypothetical protein